MADRSGDLGTRGVPYKRFFGVVNRIVVDVFEEIKGITGRLLLGKDLKAQHDLDMNNYDIQNVTVLYGNEDNLLRVFAEEIDFGVDDGLGVDLALVQSVSPAAGDPDFELGNNVTPTKVYSSSPLNLYTGGIPIVLYAGSGSPEGVVTADPGSLYVNVDGGGGYTALYKKDTGSGNTGWTAV